MKIFATSLCLLVCLFANIATSFALNDITQVQVDGTWYTNGQTAYIQCNKSNVDIYITCFPDDPNPGCIPLDLSTSSNFSKSTDPSNVLHNLLYLDASHLNGSITARLQGVPGGATVTVYIQQKPPVPTFTATPAICSVSTNATYSASDSYAFNSTYPLTLTWSTTGGATVNGNSSATTSGNSGGVTVQWSSLGTVSVQAVIASCSNLASDGSSSVYVGTPTSSNITFSATGGGDNGSSFCPGNTRNYQSSPNLPLSQYSYSWSIPTGSSNVTYFYSYGPNATVTAGSAGGGFVLQMNVTPSGCSTVGSTSRTFFITSCGGGYYRVAKNPVSDKVTTVFDATDDTESLPDALRLTSEKSGTIKEVKVRGQYSSQLVKDGLTVDIDVQTLPRGTYYLQGIYSDNKTESIRVILQ